MGVGGAGVGGDYVKWYGDEGRQPALRMWRAHYLLMGARLGEKGLVAMATSQELTAGCPRRGASGGG